MRDPLLRSPLVLWGGVEGKDHAISTIHVGALPSIKIGLVTALISSSWIYVTHLFLRWKPLRRRRPPKPRRWGLEETWRRGSRCFCYPSGICWRRASILQSLFLCADRWRITPRAMRSRQADPSRRIILTLPTLIQFSQVLLISFNFFPFRTLFHHIRRWHLRHTFFFLFNYTRTYKIK